MSNFLRAVLAKKEADLIRQKHIRPLSSLRERLRYQTVKSEFLLQMTRPHAGELAIIAEIKLASPTQKALGSKEEIAKRVRAYEEAGADAISLITEPHYFHGSTDMVIDVRKQTTVPILQKDFVIDAYQIYEAGLIGVDALLLIAKTVEEKKLHEFVSLALSLGIEPVVEINDAEELEKTLQTKTKIIAVNARDLDTLQVDIIRACDLLKLIPDRYLRLGFSGIHGATDVEKYKKAGANGVLVGTALMQAKNTQEFLGGLR